MWHSNRIAQVVQKIDRAVEYDQDDLGNTVVVEIGDRRSAVLKAGVVPDNGTVGSISRVPSEKLQPWNACDDVNCVRDRLYPPRASALGPFPLYCSSSSGFCVGG